METPELMLTYLSIQLVEWGANKGTLTGTAKFRQRDNEVTLKIDQQAARKIVELCATAVVETAQRVAQQISAEVILQVPAALEDKPC